MLVAEECDRAGVKLHFVTEPLDGSPEGQLLTLVRGCTAKIEHAKIREGTKAGQGRSRGVRQTARR
jgi:hypothetical protein